MPSTYDWLNKANEQECPHKNLNQSKQKAFESELSSPQLIVEQDQQIVKHCGLSGYRWTADEEGGGDAKIQPHHRADYCAQKWKDKPSRCVWCCFVTIDEQRNCNRS